MGMKAPEKLLLAGLLYLVPAAQASQKSAASHGSSPAFSVPAGLSEAKAQSLPVLLGAIDASLPGLSMQNLFIPGPTGKPLSLQEFKSKYPLAGLETLSGPAPSVWQPEKSAALKEALIAAGESSAQGQALAELAKHSPRKVLETVNAVLKDFKAGDIARLTGPELEALSGLILEPLGLKEPAPRERLHGALVLSKRQMRKIAALEGKDPVETADPAALAAADLKDMAPPVPYDVKGLPWSFRVHQPSLAAGPETLFRYYTRDDILANILFSGMISNGSLPYIEASPYISRKYFHDLTGAFLTLPGVDGREVGVGAEAGRYVDLRLPPDLPVVQPSRSYPIYLVPLPKRIVSWRRELHERWLSGASLSDYELKNAIAVDEQGGPGPRILFPVEIIGHGP